LLPITALAQYPANPAQPPAKPLEKIFNAETFTLINGLQVVVIPNHRSPVVNEMVWYKVGSADEDPHQSGIAHFVEHLMFKGSANVPPGAFATRIKTMGGEENAFTGQDYTAYHETVTVDHLPEVMDMESDRMKSLLFPPDQVKSERQVVLEERRQRTEDNPQAYFEEQMRALLFINHPYGHPVGGWFNEVDALTRDNVMAYYHKWYAPNNAVLILSGDITAKQAELLANRTFGTIPARNVPDRDWTRVPPMIALPRLVLHSDDIQQPVFERIVRVPSLRQNHQDALALEVLAEIVGDGDTSRLYKSLVIQQKLATGIDFDYDPLAWDDALVQIEATPAENVSMEKLESAVDGQLRLLIRSGVAPAELSAAKTRMKDAAIFSRDSLEGPSMMFGSTLAEGGSMDDVELWPQQIDSVTAAQIQDVAKRFLDPDNFNRRPYMTGWLLPSGTPHAVGAPVVKTGAETDVIQ
jgi:zinc protease